MTDKQRLDAYVQAAMKLHLVKGQTNTGFAYIYEYAKGMMDYVEAQEVQKVPKPVELYKNTSYLVQTNELVSKALWSIRSACILAAKRGEPVLVFDKRYPDDLFKVHILSAIEIIRYELPVVKETDEEIVLNLFKESKC